jgi:hypothetical protein
MQNHESTVACVSSLTVSCIAVCDMCVSSHLKLK